MLISLPSSCLTLGVRTAGVYGSPFFSSSLMSSNVTLLAGPLAGLPLFAAVVATGVGAAGSLGRAWVGVDGTAGVSVRAWAADGLSAGDCPVQPLSAKAAI